MFCQQCGAEAPIRALTCPTCGHDLGRSAADLRSTMALPESSSSSPGTSNLSLPLATSPNSASIRPGDLDRPGWPRDAPGRILLLVVLALEVDLFLLPWRLVDSQHETLPTFAGLAIAVLVLLAAVPLFHPRLRQRPLWTVLPVLVGGICLGIGLAFWVNPTPPTIFYSDLYRGPPISNLGTDGGAVPDVGLFGFLIGALILVGIGYRVFLAAARTTGPVPVATAAAAHPKSVPVSPLVALVPGLPPEIQKASAIVLAPEPDTGEQPLTKAFIPRPAEIALPGSEAWGRTLDSPVFQRPKSGLLRRSHR